MKCPAHPGHQGCTRFLMLRTLPPLFKSRISALRSSTIPSSLTRRAFSDFPYSVRRVISACSAAVSACSLRACSLAAWAAFSARLLCLFCCAVLFHRTKKIKTRGVVNRDQENDTHTRKPDLTNKTNARSEYRCHTQCIITIE